MFQEIKANLYGNFNLIATFTDQLEAFRRRRVSFNVVISFTLILLHVFGNKILSNQAFRDRSIFIGGFGTGAF